MRGRSGGPSFLSFRAQFRKWAVFKDNPTPELRQAIARHRREIARTLEITNTNFTGTDTLTYHANDRNHSVQGSVTVTINP